MKYKFNQPLFLLISVLLSWLIPSNVSASVLVDGIYYELNTSAKTAAVASNPDKYTGAIDIPANFVYNGSTYKVTSIGSCAFLGCSELTSISMPSSVTTIGSSAFERCTGLTDVAIGSGVTFIDYEAFNNCSNLATLTLPVSLKTIENETFANCTSLTEIVAKRTTAPTIQPTTFNGVDKATCKVYVPEGCQSAYANATNWKSFSNIEELTIVAAGSCGANGDNVTYTIYSDMTMVISGSGVMKDYDFISHINNDYYQYLKKVIIEDGVTSISKYAFYNCTSLTSVTIPSGAASIGDYAFYNCLSLTSVAIPSGVISIGSSAFSDCEGLTAVTIPSGLTTIGHNAFQSCTCLTSISIPGSVTSIGFFAFKGCSGLISIRVDSNNVYYDSRDNCNAIIETTSNTLLYGCKNTVIPNSVTSIGGYAFYDCRGLISMTIPNSVASIGDWTFFNCIGLTSIAIPNSVTTVGEAAFEKCTGLTYVEIPSSVVSIGHFAFYECTGLISVKIPDSVTYLGEYVFVGCTDLASVTIPNSLTSIEMGTFSGCTTLTSVSIPSSVTRIDDSAFSYCTGLASISVESEVPATLGNNVFKGVNKSDCALYVPYGSKSAYEVASQWNEFENIVERPLSIEELYYNLYSSEGTATVVGILDKDYSGGITIPESVEYAGNTYSVTCVGDYAFRNCTGLTSVTIPNSVTSIGDWAFNGCSCLESIIFGNGLSVLGNEVFSGTKWYDNQSDGLVYAGTVVCKYKGHEIENTQDKEIVIKEGTLGICPEAFLWRNPNEKGDVYTFSFASIILPSSLIYLPPVYHYSYIFCNAFNNIDDSTLRAESISVDPNNPIFDSRENCNAIIETATNKLIIGSKNTIIPNGVVSLGDFTLGRLTTVRIPSSVSSIDEFAFCDLRWLREPEDRPLDDEDKDWTSSLVEEIIMEGQVPPSAVLSGVNKSTCILYVPVDSKYAYENAEGWKDFQNIVEYESDTDISALDNAIYVDQIEGRVGGTMDIPIKLKNSYAVRGFQFTMELPEGTTINNWALSSARMPSGVTMSDLIATRKIEGSKITVACSLNYGNATFTGNDGEIATVNVTFGEDVEVGTYPIYLTACDVTTAGGTDEDLSDVKATLVLEDYVVGDANGDGKVRIGDATTILNYIVGTTSDNFNEKAADANGDGKIRIGDATTVLNIIVNQ